MQHVVVNTMIFTKEGVQLTPPTLCVNCGHRVCCSPREPMCKATEVLDYATGEKSYRTCKEANGIGCCRAYFPLEEKVASDEANGTFDMYLTQPYEVGKAQEDEVTQEFTEEYTEGEFIEEITEDVYVPPAIHPVAFYRPSTDCEFGAVPLRGFVELAGPYRNVESVIDVNDHAWIKDPFRHGESPRYSLSANVAIKATIESGKLAFINKDGINGYIRAHETIHAKPVAPEPEPPSNSDPDEPENSGRNPIKYGTVMAAWHANYRGQRKAAIGDSNGVLWEKLKTDNPRDHDYVVPGQDALILAELIDGWLVFTDQLCWDAYIAMTRKDQS